MSNTDFVKSMYAAFGRGDIKSVVDACDPTIVWWVIGDAKDYPTLGMRNGSAGVTGFFKDVGANIEFSEFSPQNFYEASSKVFVEGHYAGTVKKTGRKVSSDFLHVFTIAGGKVTHFREFTDTAQIAAAYR